MYEEKFASGLAQYADKGSLANLPFAQKPLTIRENIEREIVNHQRQIDRLNAIKAQLESGAGLLEIKIDDLRMVMNY